MWTESRRRAEYVSIAATTALVAIAVVVFLETRMHWDAFGSEMIALAEALGLAVALAIVYPYSKRIYDPALPLRSATYSYSQSYVGGQARTERQVSGSRTSKVSRRGAILMTVVGLLIYAGATISVVAGMNSVDNIRIDHRTDGPKSKPR